MAAPPSPPLSLARRLLSLSLLLLLLAAALLGPRPLSVSAAIAPPTTADGYRAQLTVGWYSVEHSDGLGSSIVVPAPQRSQLAQLGIFSIPDGASFSADWGTDRLYTFMTPASGQSLPPISFTITPKSGAPKKHKLTISVAAGDADDASWTAVLKAGTYVSPEVWSEGPLTKYISVPATHATTPATLSLSLVSVASVASSGYDVKAPTFDLITPALGQRASYTVRVLSQSGKGEEYSITVLTEPGHGDDVDDSDDGGQVTTPKLRWSARLAVGAYRTPLVSFDKTHLAHTLTVPPSRSNQSATLLFELAAGPVANLTLEGTVLVSPVSFTLPPAGQSIEYPLRVIVGPDWRDYTLTLRTAEHEEGCFGIEEAECDGAANWGLSLPLIIALAVAAWTAQQQ